jgi:cobyrinic acid a,c-diamide synthase
MSPRLIIAAPMSGSGKTTITAGLIAALGARVAGAKVTI